jgi:hypothetical protein
VLRRAPTDEGISYYLKSVALDPAYPQVREYLGEAYVIQDKFDLAKDELATIEKLCGKECEYYQGLSEALSRRTHCSLAVGGPRQDIAARVSLDDGAIFKWRGRFTRHCAPIRLSCRRTSLSPASFWLYAETMLNIGSIPFWLRRLELPVGAKI